MQDLANVIVQQRLTLRLSRQERWRYLRPSPHRERTTVTFLVALVKQKIVNRLTKIFRKLAFIIHSAEKAQRKLLMSLVCVGSIKEGTSSF